MFYQDSAPRMLAVMSTLFAISSIMVFLRIYTRTTRAVWGWDDTFMVIGYAPMVTLTAFAINGVQNGIGTKTEHIDGGAAEELRGFKDLYFFELFYCITFLFVKPSIALTLKRIANGKKVYVYIIYFIIVCIVVPLLYFLIFDLSRCNKIEANWNTTLAGAKCSDYILVTNGAYAIGATGIFTDWCCAIMPIFLLWNVKMKPMAKVSVTAILSLGFFASVASMLRLKYTIKLANPGKEYLYGLSDLVIWAYCEVACGVIVGCASTLRPLFAGVFRLGAPSRTGYALQDHGHSHNHNHNRSFGGTGFSHHYSQSVGTYKGSGTSSRQIGKDRDRDRDILGLSEWDDIEALNMKEPAVTTVVEAQGQGQGGEGRSDSDGEERSLEGERQGGGLDGFGSGRGIRVTYDVSSSTRRMYE